MSPCQRTCFFLCVLAIAGGAFWGAAPAGAEDRSAITVSVRFVDSTVFVGERPKVRIAVTAPEGLGLELLKKDMLVVYGSVIFDLRDSKGRPVPGGSPISEPIRPRAWPGNFSPLAAGKTRAWVTPIFSHSPQTPGEYVLRIELRPLWNEKWVYQEWH